MKKRVLAMLLAVVMVVGMLPVTALAKPSKPTKPPVEQNQDEYEGQYVDQDNSDPHTHSFAEAWTISGNTHYHACTAEGCDIIDYATCNIPEAAFGYHMFTIDSGYTTDEINHPGQHANACICGMDGGNWVDHDFSKGDCVCGAKKPSPDDWFNVNNGVIELYRGPEDVDVVIPETIGGAAVTGIYNGVFISKGIKSVSGPSIVSLGERTFSDCAKLESVSFPKVTSAGKTSFQNCGSLVSVDMPKLTGIASNAFTGCSSLESVSFPDAATIGDHAFAGCVKLASVSAPKATSIGECAFSNCGKLTEISLPQVTDFGDAAFEYCDSLTSFVFPGGAKIGSRLFASPNCAISRVEFLGVPVLIAERAFDGVGSFDNPAQLILPEGWGEDVPDEYGDWHWGTFAVTKPDEPSTAHTHGEGDDAVTFEKAITTIDELIDLFTNGGSGYLANDITLTEEVNLLIPMRKTVSLCLSGHVLNLNGNGHIYAQSKGETFSLYDCGTTEHYFTVGDDGLWTLTDTKTDKTKTVVGGVLTGNGEVAAISLSTEDNVVSIYGGTICGNKDGAVRATSLYMYGGTICGNVVDSGSAAVSASGVNVQISGKSVIKDNFDSDGNQSNLMSLYGIIADLEEGADVGLTPSIMKGLPVIFADEASAGYLSVDDTVNTSLKSFVIADLPEEGYPALVCEMLVEALDPAPETCLMIVDNPHVHDKDTADEITFDTAIDSYEELELLLGETGGSGYLTKDIICEEGLEVDMEVNLCLNGHVIRYVGEENSSVITINSGATLNLYDCDTKTEHAGYVDANGLWHLGTGTGTEKTTTGGVITGGKAENGGGVYVIENGCFTIYGGSIIGNTATKYGGGVCIYSGSFTMHGGSISGNTAAENGGGVNVYSGSFTMNGGAITDNKSTAKYGGGVFINSGSFTMTGGSITGNTAQCGGGIQNQGTMKLLAAGGKTITITDNKVTKSEGGIANWGALSLSGKVIIKDNICSTVNSPVNLATYNAITIAGALTGSEIGITHIDGDDKHDLGVLTDGFTDKNPGAKLGDFFTYDGPDTFTMVLNASGDNAGELEVKVAPPHVHNMGTPENESDDITFTAWTSENSLPGSDNLTDNAGSFYLTKDVTLSGTWTVPTGTVNLCLNGHVIKQTVNANVITVGSGATLNLYDCDTATVHNGYVDANGLWHLDATNEHNGLVDEKDITGGIITGGTGLITTGTNTVGGGVYINGGKVTMNGGTITGNTAAQYGGGVFVASGSFTMNGGAVSYNTATSYGGGVSVFGGKFDMDGGTISGNYGAAGGGVMINSGVTFTMTDGTIKDNKAGSTGGGGVMCNSASIMKMSGGTISGNTTTGNGGGIYNLGALTVTGGTITGNSGGGGGVLNYGGYGTITLGGTAKITGNTLSDGTASNLYLMNSTITLGTREHCSYCRDTRKCQVCGGDGKEECGICAGTGCDGCGGSGYFGCSASCGDGTCKYCVLGNGVWTPTEDMNVGITLYAKTGAFTIVGISADYSANFFSDDESYKVLFNAGTDADGDEYLELKQMPTVTVSTDGNGNVNITSISEVACGTPYDINVNVLVIGGDVVFATPNEGYEFDCWKIGETVVNTNGTITADTTFTATFKAIILTYTITNNTTEDDKETNHGYITIDKATAAANDTVTITVTPSDGYKLTKLTVAKTGDAATTVEASGSGNTYTFAMPAYAVTVSAEFEENITLEYETGHGDVTIRVESETTSTPSAVEVPQEGLNDDQQTAAGKVQTALSGENKSNIVDLTEVVNNRLKELDMTKVQALAAATDTKNGNTDTSTELTNLLNAVTAAKEQGKDVDMSMKMTTDINVAITDIKVEQNDKTKIETYTLDIQPVYSLTVESVIKEPGKDDEKNTITVAQNEPLEVTETTVVSFPAPVEFELTEGDVLYVVHEKQNGEKYTYVADFNSETGMISFTNPHGFSEFSMVKVSGMVAVNTATEVFYGDLTKALTDAESEATSAAPQTIQLLTDLTGDSKVSTVEVAPNVTLDLNGYDLEAKTVLAWGLVMNNRGSADGKLIVAEDHFTYFGGKEMAASAENVMPVWDTTGGTNGYVFYAVSEIKHWALTNDAGDPKYMFQPKSNGVQTVLGENSGVRVYVDFSYTQTDSQGTHHKHLTVEFGRSYLTQFLADPDTLGMYVTLLGTEGVSNITAKSYLKAENCNFSIESAEINLSGKTSSN